MKVSLETLFDKHTQQLWNQLSQSGPLQSILSSYTCAKPQPALHNLLEFQIAKIKKRYQTIKIQNPKDKTICIT